VVDDPDVVMQVQADDTVPQTSLGLNIGFSTFSGDTATGNSETSADVASAAVTATLPLRIVGFVDGPESAVGDAFTDLLVKWNMPAAVYTAGDTNAQNATVVMARGHSYMNPTGV
jgi:hypothetical protein